jgi:negative regulator of sigma-B (phosphoserine phosphatase)
MGGLTMTGLLSQPMIEWGVASRCAPGEDVCGDMHLVKMIPDGVLLAVVDGLGHGVEAMAASQTAVDILKHHATEPLDNLFRRCHEALAATRGVVMTLAVLRPNGDRLTWVGIGNVEAAVLTAIKASPAAWSESAVKWHKAAANRVLLRSGILGYRLSQVRPSTQTISRGDLVILATDGVRADFLGGAERNVEPQILAEKIL